MSERYGNRKLAADGWLGADMRNLVGYLKEKKCQQLCASNPDCLYWTFKKSVNNDVDGVAGTASNCLLKANVEKLTPNSDFISGSKHCTFPAE